MRRLLFLTLLIPGCASSPHAALSEAALRAPEVSGRYMAVLELGETDDPAVLPTLHLALTDPDPGVREEAASAIRGIDAALRARVVRYLPPTGIPEAALEDPATWLKAHRRLWDYTVSRRTLEEFRGPELSIPYESICELPPMETSGSYAGQKDGGEFLAALHRRSKREPHAVEEFRALRESILQAHPDWRRPAKKD